MGFKRCMFGMRSPTTWKFVVVVGVDTDVVILLDSVGIL